jgi:hypothetical protein
MERKQESQDSMYGHCNPDCVSSRQEQFQHVQAPHQLQGRVAATNQRLQHTCNATNCCLQINTCSLRTPGSAEHLVVSGCYSRRQPTCSLMQFLTVPFAFTVSSAMTLPGPGRRLQGPPAPRVCKKQKERNGTSSAHTSPYHEQLLAAAACIVTNTSRCRKHSTTAMVLGLPQA